MVKRKKRPRLTNQVQLRRFLARIMTEYYNDDLDDAKFRNLKDGCKELKEIVDAADIQKQLDDLKKQVEEKR